jgi:hypothetical protein
MSDSPRIPTEIQKQIALGLDVERFLESEAGKWMTAQAEEMVQHGLHALAEADAEDPKAIRALQNDVKVGEQIQYWLAGLVNQGRNAEEQYLRGDEDAAGA